MLKLNAFAGLLTLMALCTPCGRCGESKVWFVEDFNQPLGDRWKQIEFHAPTDYRVVIENSNRCLRARAQESCSALGTKVDVQPGLNMVLSWRWKIDSCPTNASDDKLRTFDH